MNTQMRKIDISCVISIALERFQNGIFLISGNFGDEKTMNSLILVCCPGTIVIKRKVSINL